ncbi:MAG: hypothetical protein RSF84_07205 [Ruthenibacterium sp.]
MVHRSLLDWEWYSDINTKVLFLHLLLTVNYEPQKWRGKIIERGQRVVGRKNLSVETSLSEQNIRTSLKRLISTNEITIQSTKEYSVITINNYDKYQALEQQLTNSQPTANQQLTTMEESNKANKAIRGTDAAKPPRTRFVKPTVKDIALFCAESGISVDANRFVDYYDSNGWHVGKSTMKDWKAAVRGWARRDAKSQCTGNPFLEENL